MMNLKHDNRIRCLNCGWEDNNELSWQCTCIYILNPFQTDCVCPVCKTNWDYIQCPCCGMPMPKHTYYRSGNKLTANFGRNTHAPFLKTVGINTFEYQMILDAWKWKIAYDECLTTNRLSEFAKERQLGNENLSAINEGMNQIIYGKGSSINAPIYCKSLLDFKNLLKVLSIKIIECKSKYMIIEERMNVEMYSIESVLKKGTFNIYVSYPMENASII